jgi:glycolate oxidase
MKVMDTIKLVEQSVKRGDKVKRTKMELAKDFYRAFEDVVGPEYISIDQAVVDGYAFQPFGGAQMGMRFFLRPLAIVLPDSTKQVQSIVKLCNRFGLKYKASSTGYGAANTVGSEDTIIMDMRRMNRILDIDEKNMVVLVEPYVSFAQVQAEAMKLGLSTHVIGAGSNASYVASLTSVVGNNTQSISQGYSARNLLGMEWVMPTGELCRVGSWGSVAGWFSGDGPGPSLRGIIRGSAGATGALGVFTRCAGHLHPWPGPSEIEVKGNSPYYEAELPSFFEYHVIAWPTWEKCADALYKIGESGIAYAFHKTGGPGSHGSCVTGSNNEYYSKRQAGEMLIPEVSWAFVSAGFNAEEHQYQVKVLNRILEETQGSILPLGEDPTWKKRDFLTMVKACFIPRLAFRLTGTFGCDGMMGQETLDNVALALKMDRSLRDKYSDKGVIMNDGTYNNWGVVYEGGHLGVIEGGYSFSSTDGKAFKGFAEMVQEGTELALKTPLGYGWMAMGGMAKVYGPQLCNVHEWMRQIKKTFDPNTVSDPLGYI